MVRPMTSDVSRSIEQDFAAYALALAAVVEELPVGAVVALDADLVHLRPNRRLRELLGIGDETDIGHGAPGSLPYRCRRADVELRLEDVSLRLAVVAGREVEAQAFELGRADGMLCRLVSSAAPLRDGGGAVRGALAVFGDSTALHDAVEQLQRSEEFNRRILASTQDCVKVVTLDGRLVSMNPNGAEALAIDDLGAVLGASWLEFWSGAERAAAERALSAAAGGGVGRFTGFFATLRGDARWWDVTISPMLDRQGRPETLLVVSRDISDRRRAEMSSRFLSAAGERLNASLDLEATWGTIAELSVETIADFCFVDLLHEGRLERVATAHRDRDQGEFMAQAVSFAGGAANPAHPVSRALRDEPVLVPVVGAGFLDDLGLAAEHASFVRRLGVSSLIVVPVSAHGTILGTLAFGLTAAASGTRRYMEADLELAREFGNRAGIALENAQRYQRERRVASSLQAASLPRTLPALPGYAFDAVYEPGQSEAEIGGDWYDAFRLPDGRIGISIGDVTGSGLEAAVLMGRLRQALRAAAAVDPDPAAALRAADFILRSDEGELLATAFFAVLDPADGRLVYANAGHHAPLLVGGDGRLRAAGGALGLPLGIRLPEELPSAALQLRPGDFVLFFTDGLVESTRDLIEGERRLHAALGERGLREAARPAAAIRDAVLSGGSRDDVAILTLTVG